MEVSETKDQETLPSLNPPVPSIKKLIKYTMDGAVMVERITHTTTNSLGAPKEEFLDNELPLEEEPLIMPEKFPVALHSEMSLFHSLLRTIKKQRPTRTVPITRTELQRAGADPKIVRALVDVGFLVEDIIPLVREDGKNPGSRVCVFYTPQGRAYVREKIDPSYLRHKEAR